MSENQGKDPDNRIYFFADEPDDTDSWRGEGSLPQNKPAILFADEPEQGLTCVTHEFSIAGRKGHLTPWFDSRGVRKIGLSVVNTGSQLAGWAEGLEKMVNLALQHGVPLRAVTAVLKSLWFDPQGRTTNEAIPIARSIPDYIGLYLEMFEEDLARNQ